MIAPANVVFLPRRLLIVVEGTFDIDFLKRISRTLHAAHACLPDLQEWETSGRLIFIPAGGDRLQQWVDRLEALQQPEFHLYDRESPPETSAREQVVSAINQRPRCVARLTSKRSLENYLHPTCIQEGCGVEIVMDDEIDVAEQVARQLLARHGLAWEQISRRGRRRLRNHVKKLLNTAAAERMSPERLVERDPQGEVIGWLQIMHQLLTSD